MNKHENNPNFRDDADGLLTGRLQQLGSMPVDTSELDKALRSAIPQRPQRRGIFIGSISGLAAAAVVVATLLLINMGSSAQASSAQLAALYQQVTSTHLSAGQSGGLAANPKAVPSCCYVKVGRHPMACCVYARSHGRAVLVVSCTNHEMQPPAGAIVTANGKQYTVTHGDKLNMVMLSRAGHWVCAIGPQSPAILQTYLAKSRNNGL